MQLNFAGRSLFLFALALVALVTLTLFESALVGLSLMAERVITLLALVLLPAIGAALGVMSLIRKEGRTGLAIAGFILNTLFAIFHMMIVLFAG